WGGPAESTKMVESLYRLRNLLSLATKISLYPFAVPRLKYHQVEHVPDVQTDVVQRIVELVSHPRRQLADGRQPCGLHELLLLVAKLLLSPADLLGSVAQVAHDVDHCPALIAQPTVRLCQVHHD